METTPVAAEVKWCESPESKEASAAESVCLDGNEDLRNTPAIISESTAIKIFRLREMTSEIEEGKVKNPSVPN